jgi:hypothetical protein
MVFCVVPLLIISLNPNLDFIRTRTLSTTKVTAVHLADQAQSGLNTRFTKG